MRGGASKPGQPDSSGLYCDWLHKGPQPRGKLYTPLIRAKMTLLKFIASHWRTYTIYKKPAVFECMCAAGQRACDLSARALLSKYLMLIYYNIRHPCTVGFHENSQTFALDDPKALKNRGEAWLIASDPASIEDIPLCTFADGIPFLGGGELWASMKGLGVWWPGEGG